MHRVFFGSVLIALCVVLIGCKDPNSGLTPKGSVVLYTSADDHLARLLADAFTEESGIKVEILGDTEATKTTGLVARILAERDDPVGDVWWSSESMGTILLARNGALKTGGMRGMVGDDWPEALVGEDWSWVGFAQRARVIAYSPSRVDEPPTTMRDLMDPKWKERIGIARPQFGTTRGHMALLHARWGDEVFGQWLEGLKANRVRMYSGNMGVVQGIAMGEIDIALTDTDDVFVGQENGWDVGLVYESHDDSDRFMPSVGATMIPNTVGIIQGGPNPDEAMQLARFLVSPKAERIIAQSVSRNFPVSESLADEFSDLVPDGVRTDAISYDEAHESVDAAMDACERTLEGP